MLMDSNGVLRRGAAVVSSELGNVAADVLIATFPESAAGSGTITSQVAMPGSLTLQRRSCNGGDGAQMDRYLDLFLEVYL